MAGLFNISQEVERLNARWVKCDEIMRKSRGLWNDSTADFFISEYWCEFERVIPNMISYLNQLNEFLSGVGWDI